MVEESIDVRSGVVRYRVGIRATSIRRAASLAKGLYPASGVRVIFPIDPRRFFVEDPSVKEGVIAADMPHEEQEVA